MAKAIIDGIACEIKYGETKIGDTVYDKNSKRSYIATIADADDLNWLVVNKFPTYEAKQISMVQSVFENLHIQIGDEWYYMTHEDIVKLLKKSKAKLKIVKKRTRTWAEPIK